MRLMDEFSSSTETGPATSNPGGGARREKEVKECGRPIQINSIQRQPSTMNEGRVNPHPTRYGFGAVEENG